MPSRTMARGRAIAAAATLALLLACVGLRPAHAQFLPAVLYGAGVAPGQHIEAFIQGKSCASTTANPRGEWLMQIPVDAPCQPTPDAAIAFTLDGKPAAAEPAATWQSGGIPTANIRTGYSLTLEGSEPGAGSSQTENDDGGGGTSPLLFVVVGIVVVAVAAGGGLLLYRRRAA